GSIGIGFAIPSNITENVVTQLREFGETRRGWLGVRIQSVTDELAESFGLDKARGALVAEVTDGGPAEQAGIRVGDVILSFNDTDVPEMRDLPRIVAETQVGKKVQVVVWRDGRKKDFDVTLGRLEDFERAEGVAAAQPDKQGSEIADLGLTLIPLNDIVREQFGIPENVEGVAVIDVESASAAAEKGIRPGDVIVEVAQQEVSSPADVSKKVAEIRKSDKKSVLLLLNRGGDLRFVAVRLADE
ncbi:MAG TPA: serine protease, partial [Alphaproteobacteria bacterium]|nr:serine protease [Alphaproteobacteria bacterium]